MIEKKTVTTYNVNGKQFMSYEEAKEYAMSILTLQMWDHCGLPCTNVLACHAIFIGSKLDAEFFIEECASHNLSTCGITEESRGLYILTNKIEFVPILYEDVLLAKLMSFSDAGTIDTLKKIDINQYIKRLQEMQKNDRSKVTNI